MSEAVIEKIHTSCLGCHFAVVEDKEQTGCRLNLLEKYQDSVVSCYNEQEEQFFVINGKYCKYKRSSKWGEGLTLGKAQNRARKEIGLKIELIIYLDKFDSKLLEKTVISGIRQKHAITSICVINNSQDFSISDQLGDLVSSYNKPWFIRNIIEEGASPNRCLDIAVKNSKFPYFIACNAGYSIPNILHKIDSKINDSLETITAVGFGKSETPEAVFSQTFLYKTLHGNAGDYTFWQKLLEIQKEEQNTYSVIRDTDL